MSSFDFEELDAWIMSYTHRDSVYETFPVVLSKLVDRIKELEEKVESLEADRRSSREF